MCQRWWNVLHNTGAKKAVRLNAVWWTVLLPLIDFVVCSMSRCCVATSLLYVKHSNEISLLLGKHFIFALLLIFFESFEIRLMIHGSASFSINIRRIHVNVSSFNRGCELKWVYFQFIQPLHLLSDLITNCLRIVCGNQYLSHVHILFKLSQIFMAMLSHDASKTIISVLHDVFW